MFAVSTRRRRIFCANRYQAARFMALTWAFFQPELICNQTCFPNLRPIHAIRDKVRFSSISFLKIVLHSFAQNNDLVRIFRSIFFALVDKLRTKSWLPFLALPINAMDGNNNSFSKHLRQPCKERWSFGVDVHHIVFSKCTIKCRKCGGADCSKSPWCQDRGKNFLEKIAKK